MKPASEADLMGEGLSPAVVPAQPTAADLAAEIERIRQLPGRQSFEFGGVGQKLALPPIPGYHQHWFNDERGRVQAAKANGWSNVTGTDGEPIKRSVGTGRDGEGLTAYAMKIPLVIWREDQAAQNNRADEQIRAVKEKPISAPAGMARPSDRGKFYSPNEVAGRGDALELHDSLVKTQRTEG